MARGIVRQNMKTAKARREFALARNDFRYPSDARSSPAGPTSMAVKVRDEAETQMIERFLKQRERKDG